MSKISYNSLKSKCASLGFTLSKTPFGIYQVTAKGEHGCTFDGTFREIWAWHLGYDFCKQATRNQAAEAVAEALDQYVGEDPNQKGAKFGNAVCALKKYRSERKR